MPRGCGSNRTRGTMTSSFPEHPTWRTDAPTLRRERSVHERGPADRRAGPGRPRPDLPRIHGAWVLRSRALSHRHARGVRLRDDGGHGQEGGEMRNRFIVNADAIFMMCLGIALIVSAI